LAWLVHRIAPSRSTIAVRRLEDHSVAAEQLN
jgi:hypothetical protein